MRILRPGFGIRRRVGWVADRCVIAREILTGRRLELAIFDDIYPLSLSAFRYVEFSKYLAEFPRSKVYSSGASMHLLGENRSFSEVVHGHLQSYPEHYRRIEFLSANTSIYARLAYTVFLNNALRVFDTAARLCPDFVMTLYPGGGFVLDDSSLDDRMKALFTSSRCKQVIVTQQLTRAYLLQNGLIDPTKITFIYGGAFPSEHSNVPQRLLYKQDKNTFDICFVANKYTPQGVDKGYDMFVEVAKEFLAKHPDVRFHVVGNFSRDDIDVSSLNDRIEFYGMQPTSFFRKFYSRMDVILSPNVPFLLRPGAFDGFPLGCCIEAAMSGVAVFCTDALHENSIFQSGQDIEIITHDTEDICSRLEHYYNDYGKLRQLADRGSKAFQDIFDVDKQMRARIAVLSQYMK